MKLTKESREQIRMMFGGKCAYCGVELSGKWHVDHASPVRRKYNVVHEVSEYGVPFRTRWIPTGQLRQPHNDVLENCMPACIKCNILKADADIEGFRSMLIYFATSIPHIQTYSHVHHLMRFKKLTIDVTPVVFWFETYLAEKESAHEAITVETENAVTTQDATPGA